MILVCIHYANEQPSSLKPRGSGAVHQRSKGIACRDREIMNDSEFTSQFSAVPQMKSDAFFLGNHYHTQAKVQKPIRQYCHKPYPTR